MLPINRKRALQIPHGLAIAAAAICLVLAFSTDLQTRHEQISAERSEPTPVQLLAGSEDGLIDKASRVDQRAEPRTRDPRRAPMPLFPWFPGLGGSGG